MNTSIKAILIKEFQTRFGEQPSIIVRAPGRVNLIGEHTDYNDGFVLPMAIDRATWIALRPRFDQIVSVYSANLEKHAEFFLDDLKKSDVTWVEYLKGTAWALQNAGYTLQGWEGVMIGDIPVGAGLSSSASLELATARALLTLTDYNWEATKMAQLAQQAENKWVGINCGIMDQMISATGQANHALLIDCRSLEISAVPLPQDTVVVVMDTNTRRGLVDSAYNERRQQCEAAATFFGVTALRDVTINTFQEKGSGLDNITRKRAKHIITENDRTLHAKDAMENNDPVTLGQLLNESHLSLRDDFEVSSNELNLIVSIAQQIEGCYGARMTGAGFGGCGVALVKVDFAEYFVELVKSKYQEETNILPNIYICLATNGAEIIR